MDALVALWVLSIIGAAGFAATGYFMAWSRISREDAARAPAPASVAAEEKAPDAPAPVARVEAAPVEPPPPPFVKTVPPPAAPEPEIEPIPQSRTKTLPPPDIIRTEASSRSEKPGAYASVAPPSSKRSVAPSKAEHDHQIEALRIELRAEVVARHTVEARAKELESRLSSMSQQIWALRARATESGATKQPAQRGSAAPAPDPRARLGARAPGLFAEIDELKAEVARLQAENESLRSSAHEPAPKASRNSVRRSDLVVVGVLEHMVQRIAQLGGVRAAAVIENNGLVLASSGDRGEALATFGTALRDAAARAKRPSPLGHADEIVVRDLQGMVFSSRTLGKPEAELALVTLATAAIPVAELRDIVARTPGLGSDAISS